MNNYIHYNLQNADFEVDTDFVLISATQAQLRAIKNKKTENNTQLTMKSSELLSLIMTKDGLDTFTQEILRHSEGKKSKIDYKSYEDLFSYNGQIKSKLLTDISRLTGGTGDIAIFKTKLEEILTTVSKELGYNNYGELGKMIMLNIKENYGADTKEEVILKDFITNCDNSKFIVNSNFKGKLTNSVNKIYLLCRSLPVIGQQGTIRKRIAALSNFANRSVGWVLECSRLEEEIAIYESAIMFRHELAKALSDSKKALSSLQHHKVTFDDELEHFIKENIKKPDNYTFSGNGIDIKINNGTVDMTVNFNLKRPNFARRYGKKSPLGVIEGSERFLEGIVQMQNNPVVNVMNLSGGHSYDMQDSYYREEDFNSLQRNVGINFVLSNLLKDNDENTYFLINKTPYDLSDLAELIINSEGQIETRLKYPQKSIEENNIWEAPMYHNWESALVRSEKNERLQENNIMTYELEIMKLKN